MKLIGLLNMLQLSWMAMGDGLQLVESRVCTGIRLVQRE
jgi:hypothetical protein